MDRIVEFALRSRLLIVIVGLIVVASGFYAYTQLPVDAFPDVTPALVQVFTVTEGLAPEEVERYVTYPVEVAMNGLPDIDEIRSISNFGLSVVNVYFKDGTDIYFARQLVNERLQLAREGIPEGFGEPELGPITTGLGQILFYFVEDTTGQRSPQEMREIQDWLVKFNLQTVPGVTEVLSIGGDVKEFHALVRPDDLLRYDVALHDVVESIKANNSNVGAQFIVKNAEEYVVRSVGLAKGMEDLRNIVLKSHHGTPVYLHQVADVVIGGEVRRGLAVMDGKGETVVGMVLKLIGTNTSTVIEDTKQRMADINEVLPPGVRIETYYDQATLVAACIETVTKALTQAAVLIVVVLLLMMGGLRPSLVVILSIPFSVAFSFVLMQRFGVSANLMSLGGLAIALGLLGDSATVIIENVDRMLRRGDASTPSEATRRAFAEVIRPIVFAVVIIVLVFAPLFTLQGVEGKTFRPLAQTMVFALIGSLLYAMFLAPVLSSLLMKRRPGGGEFIVVRLLTRAYRPVVTFFVRVPVAAIGIAAALLVVGAVLFTRLGSEFVPRLNEGDLLIRATMAPSISLEEARDTISRVERRMLARFPEITRLVSRVGRGEVGAHADPVNNSEIFVALRPEEEWTSAHSLDDLYEAMGHEFENFPGVMFNFTQPIAAAVDELLTGIKGELAVKIFGPDTDVLREKGAEIEAILRATQGSADVQMDQLTGAPQLLIRVDRAAIARYGINVADVQEIIGAAVGGEEAGTIFEGIRRFGILVRYHEGARSTPEQIGHILVHGPNGVRVPLDELAEITEIVGPRQITRQNNQRFINVQCNVRGRDIGSFVEEAQAAIAAQVSMPPGYLTTWGGQFKLQQEANRRLRIVVPVTLFLVFLLLYSAFNSMRSSVLILLNIPLALVGGVAALAITGQNLSVPASVGFIALFGIALSNGMVLVSLLNQMRHEGGAMDELCIEGACLRLRAVLMTASTTGLGLIPLALASGTGSEVQRPLATVVIGGLTTSMVLTLLVIPAVYRWFAVAPEAEAAPIS
jgi:heavy metal efflux system protein